MSPHIQLPDREGRPGGSALRRDRRLRRVVRGAYAPAHLDDDGFATVDAFLALCPDGAVVSHHTVARRWGGVVPGTPEVHLSHAGSQRRRRAGLVLHRRRTSFETVHHQGIALTSPCQTFVDLATHLPLVELVVLGDSLVRAGHITPQGLIAWLRGRSTHGVDPARRAAAYVRDGVESPMETRLRMLLILAGYPEPEINRIFRGEDGSWVYRLDLSWAAWRLAVEYDGRQHAESVGQWASDIRRREDFGNWGWRILTAIASDVYADPAGFLDRLDDVLRERGVRPPRRRGGWQRHFPGRPAAR